MVNANDKYKRKIYLKSWVNALYKYPSLKVWLYVIFLKTMERMLKDMVQLMH
jgi:hypothetical protein